MNGEDQQASVDPAPVPSMKRFELMEVFNGWILNPTGYGGAQPIVVEKLKDRDNMAVLLAQISRVLGDKGWRDGHGN